MTSLPMPTLKVLLVEDDHLSRIMLASTLQSLGCEVVSCENGQEAWERFQTEKIRIVVSDWQLPGLDGLDLCKRIRQIDKDYIYFILVTNAYLQDDAENLAIQTGVDDFLPKPVKLDELRNRLRVATRFLDYTSRVQQLESFLPICCYCKKIRNDEDYWQQIEAYVSQRTGTQFSHSICPNCYQQHVIPQLEALDKGELNTDL